MEKSIKKRVRNLVDWILRRDGCLKYVGLAELLEKEFKDQKAIYDKAMDMLNEACDNTIQLEKQNMIDKACKSYCKRCVHNQTIKKCMYLGKDCPLIGAFRKDLEE